MTGTSLELGCRCRGGQAWLGRGRRAAACHRRQELLRQLGHLGEQARELPLADDLDGHGRLGDDGGRPGPVVEQRDLTHVRAGAALGDHLPALPDLDLTAQHDDELVTGLALLGEHRAGRLLEVGGELRDQAELLLREAREQRDVRELLVDAFVPIHDHSSSYPVRSLPQNGDVRPRNVRPRFRSRRSRPPCRSGGGARRRRCTCRAPARRTCSCAGRARAPVWSSVAASRC